MSERPLAKAAALGRLIGPREVPAKGADQHWINKSKILLSLPKHGRRPPARPALLRRVFSRLFRSCPGFDDARTAGRRRCAVAASIELMLKSENFNVYTTDLGEEGVDLGKLYDYDIILLDLNLPDMSGYEVLRTLRVAKVKTPILILSGLAGIEDKVKGLGFGADDYLTKPFHKDELVARIHAIVRRSKGHAQSVITTGDLIVNLDQQDGRGRRRAGASDRQGVPDAGAPLPAQGHDADQGDVPQPSLRRHGRARAQDHRRVHLQAAQEARQRFRRARTTSRPSGAAAT